MENRAVLGSLLQNEASTTIPSTNENDALDSVALRLESLIVHSLDRFQFRNAVFLAERLQAFSTRSTNPKLEQENAMFLLALCLHRQGKPERAWSTLESSETLRCRFLFAQCCLDLRRYVECNTILESILEEKLLPEFNINECFTGNPTLPYGTPDISSVFNLVGKCARTQHMQSKAIKYFKLALEHNPFLWEAAEGLSELGSPPDHQDLFKTFENQISILPQRMHTLPVFRRTKASSERPLSDVHGNVESPDFYSIKPKPISFSYQDTDGVENNDPLPTETIRKKLRRGDQSGSLKKSLSTAMMDKSTRKVSVPQMSDRERESSRMLIDMFRLLGKAYGQLCLNEFQDSIDTFKSLPQEQCESGWVQCQIAKGFFGMSEYAAAVPHFENARQRDPSIQRDMDLYSTCLWHLRKGMILSALAKELKDLNHQSPEAWCALGNAYNLGQNHDQALKCFQRATQLDDMYAYAHTLLALEYSANEAYDRAQVEYRVAMSKDPRLVSAWFGLATVYDKMGKTDLALIHYQQAQKLNPTNSVIILTIGQMEEKLSRTTEALKTYTRALEIMPSNVHARFQKAKLQVELRQYPEALRELDIVKKMSPNEPRVWMLLGKVYLMLGDKIQALKSLTWALDMDTKSSRTVKDLIARLDADPAVALMDDYDEMELE